MTDDRHDQAMPRYGELAPQATPPASDATTAAGAETIDGIEAGDSVEAVASIDIAEPATEFPAAPALAEPERVARGIALALLVIPVGVVAWTLLWNVGFIASIVSYGVALGAVWLYRVGSKARVTRASFWAILAIIVVTMVLSLLAGFFTDLAGYLNLPLMQALAEPHFWDVYWNNIFTNPDLWNSYLPQILLALAFAALGCYRTIRMLAGESRR
jgi:lysylphosphatidylglycerol synthetase-like protein (DUF2156 family)